MIGSKSAQGNLVPESPQFFFLNDPMKQSKECEALIWQYAWYILVITQSVIHLARKIVFKVTNSIIDDSGRLRSFLVE